METKIVQYFGNIMKEYRLERTEDIGNIIRHIPIHVSTNQNEFLLKPVEFQEVEEVVS